MTLRLRPFASVLAAVTIALVTVGGCASSGGPGSSSAASIGGPTSNPTPAGSPFPCDGDSTGCAGPLPAGDHASANFLLGLTFTTPEGWVNVRDIRRTYGLTQANALATEIEVMGLNAIADQTDACGPVAKPGVGSSVQDLITAVQTHPGLLAKPPVAAALDGFQGQSIDFTVAPNWPRHCPDDLIDPVVLLLTDTGNPPGRAIGYHIDQRVRWIVLDVRGETIIVELVGPSAERSFDSSVAAAQPIVDSLRFGEAR